MFRGKEVGYLRVKIKMKGINIINELFRPFASFPNNGKIKKNVLYFINLTKFHVYEQLLVEESLYRLSSHLSNDLNNVGFVIINNTYTDGEQGEKGVRCKGDEQRNMVNNKCIVLGISGKVNDYIKDASYVKGNKICIIKRFTGGGTVYMNKNCLLLSFILPHNFEKEKKIYPSNITEWIFKFIYKPFTDEKRKNSSLFNENFYYHENDFVYKTYDKENEKIILKKVGGNAQAFSKNYFVHHTSFIWYCNYQEMENVLLNPVKQPVYRNKRSHNNFLQSLKSCLHKNVDTPNLFIQQFISHIREIINKKNSVQKEEFWYFNSIYLNINEDKAKSSFHPFDNVHMVHVDLLRDIFLFYTNHGKTTNLRSTHFLDAHGNKVPDTYYQYQSFILT
ncbi:lipoate-protein ligase 2, putative [Plasmodium malariae]|uniref:Lipoate-protein ligase 2, putative n=1 Tax=Plasmodium malariae TaxID=5858 RepID=A0A1C3KBS0_PLAMA|nr:lipoate-protein ligase 2, putative [Plasmodium malariae]